MSASGVRWLEAAREDGPASAALERVYAMIDSEVRERGPACWASGRCCRFEAAGHRLFVTGLEAAYAVVRAFPGAVTTLTIAGARARGGCPFQEGNLCGAREIRPLGCRVYFCDRSAARWQQDLSERMLAGVRAIHDEQGIEYRYGEWREMLGLIVGP